MARVYQRSFQTFHGGGTVPEDLPFRAVIAAFTEERVIG